MENKTNETNKTNVGTWLGNHSTNIIATLYVIAVIGVLGILTLINECSIIWTGNELQWAIKGIKYTKWVSDKLKDVCDKVVK